MAARKGNSPNVEQKKRDTSVTKAKSTAVTAGAIDYGADSGAGMEGATVDSFAIPFLAVLQSNSPQCVKGEAKFMKTARPGMLLDTVTEELYDGEEGALFVPAAYRRTFIKWGPRQGEGGGFKGEFTADAIARMRAARTIVEFEGRLYEPLADGSVNEKRCNRFSDTRMHYGMLISSEGSYVPVLASLASTQIKKSKHLMSALTAVRVALADGRRVQPPTFASLVRIQTVPESNDQGNWFGLKFSIEGRVTDNMLYSAAKAFHDNVLQGSVTSNYAEEAGDPAGDSGASGF